MKVSAYWEGIVGLMEELMWFTHLTRDLKGFLVGFVYSLLAIFSLYGVEQIAFILTLLF